MILIRLKQERSLNRIFLFCTMLVFLGGCFPGGEFFNQETMDATSEVTVSMTVEENVVSGQLSSNSNLVQTLEVPEGNALSGTSISFPPGSLQISTTVSIEQVQDIATDSDLASLGITSSASDSVATRFSNTDGINTLSNNNVGTIQVLASSSSSSASLLLVNTSSRAMLARHRKDDNLCYTSIFKLEDSDFITKGNSDIEYASFDTPYFGSYQVITLKQTNFSDEPKTSSWGATILAQQEYTGDCGGLSKSEVDALDETKPLSIGSITTSLDSQILKFAANSISESPKSCSITIKNSESSLYASAEGSSIQLNIGDSGFLLNTSARLQCVFLDGRTLSSEAIDLPAGIKASIDESTRKITINTDHNSTGSCTLDAYNSDDSSVTFTQTVSNPSEHILDYSDDPSDIDFYGRIVCISSSGTSTESPYVRIDLGIDTSVPAVTLPTLTSFNAINEASDLYVNDSEKTSSSDAWQLQGNDFTTASFTIAINDSGNSLTCDSSQTYDQSSIPIVSSISTDGAWAVCAKLVNADGEAYFKSQQIIRDTVGPTMALSSTQSSPTTMTPINITATYSEAVTGFNSSDITLAGPATATSPTSASASVYTFDLIPSAPGTITVTINASTVNDLAGNPILTGSSFPIDYRYAPPPEPTGLVGTDGSGPNESGTESLLTWTSGGGTTSGFKIAHVPGNTAPPDCSSGTTTSGNSFSVTGLTASDVYSFRVCATNSNPTPDVSTGATLTVNLHSWEIEVTTNTTSEQMGIGIDNGTDIAIDWGDGLRDTSNFSGSNTSNQSSITHTYSTAGTYTLKIRGNATRINFYNPEAVGKITKVLSVVQGISGLTSFQYTFKDASAMTMIPPGLFDNCPNVNSFTGTFQGASSLTAIPVGLFNNNPLPTSFDNTFNGASSITSIPAGLFDNQPNVTSFVNTFSMASGLTTIPSGLFDMNTKVVSFGSTFFGTSSLTTIPSALFDKNTLVTSFSGTFRSSGLTAIPAELFDNNVAVTTFYGTFWGTAISSIPTGLFDHNPAVDSFWGTFYGTSSLTAIPTSLFDMNTMVTTFKETFANTTSISSIPTGLFDSNTIVTSFNGTFKNSAITSIPSTLFDYNTAVTDFSNLFNNATGITGAVPALWSSHPSATSTGCFTDVTSASNSGSIPQGWL